MGCYSPSGDREIASYLINKCKFNNQETLQSPAGVWGYEKNKILL